MKKSNALMLSYMIFLVIAMIAQAFFSWNGLDRIAMAATIAGCFFAFADLTGWYISYQATFAEALKRTNDSIIEIHNTMMDSLKNTTEEYVNVKKVLTPYMDRDNDIRAFVDMMDESIVRNEVEKQNKQEMLNRCEERKLEFDEYEKRNRYVKVAEISLVVCGFIAFFMIISFQYFTHILYNYQSFATVVAFLVIMFTYYLRDFIEEKKKEELDGLIQNAEERKKEAREIYEDSKKQALLEKSKTLIEQIEKYDQLKSKIVELKTDGTTK